MKWYCNSNCPKSNICARHHESGVKRGLYNDGKPEISNIEWHNDGCTGFKSATYYLAMESKDD
jgi:hypothetical protein